MVELLSYLKPTAAVLASLIGIASFIPYIWQIFKKKTKPHAYTWLIWSLTLGTAAAGVWYGGGGLILTIGTFLNVVLVALVFLLSLRYGTKNITRGDTFLLVGALAAIFVWWQLDNPVLAVLIATGVDLLGYWPTYRKPYAEPWSEDMLTWVGFILSPAFVLLALVEYNLMTATYASATLVANIILLTLCLVRRREVKKPN